MSEVVIRAARIADCEDFNVRAIHLYKKFRFKIEGTRRALSFREGEYVDAYAMARLRM